MATMPNTTCGLQLNPGNSTDLVSIVIMTSTAGRTNAWPIKLPYVSFVIVQSTTIILTAVNERKMLANHKAYHQRITGEEAERRLKLSDRRLKLSDRHSYLTRYSKPNECYTLSVYEHQTPNDVVEHFKIVIKNDARVGIEGKDTLFNKIEELLHHYEDNTIDPAFASIGQAYTLEDYKKDETRERERQERERERLQQEEQERQQRERQERERLQQEEQERQLHKTCLIL